MSNPTQQTKYLVGIVRKYALSLFKLLSYDHNRPSMPSLRVLSPSCLTVVTILRTLCLLR